MLVIAGLGGLGQVHCHQCVTAAAERDGPLQCSLLGDSSAHRISRVRFVALCACGLSGKFGDYEKPSTAGQKV